MQPIPLHDQIVLEEEDVEDQTQSGIHLPQLRKTTQREGVVVAVGPGRILPDFTRSSMSVRVGDNVIYDALSGTVIKHQGKKWVIISDKSLLAVLVEHA